MKILLVILFNIYILFFTILSPCHTEKVGQFLPILYGFFSLSLCYTPTDISPIYHRYRDNITIHHFEISLNI